MAFCNGDTRMKKIFIAVFFVKRRISCIKPAKQDGF